MPKNKITKVVLDSDLWFKGSTKDAPENDLDAKDVVMDITFSRRGLEDGDYDIENPNDWSIPLVYLLNDQIDDLGIESVSFKEIMAFIGYGLEIFDEYFHVEKGVPRGSLYNIGFIYPGYAYGSVSKKECSIRLEFEDGSVKILKPDVKEYYPTRFRELPYEKSEALTLLYLNYKVGIDNYESDEKERSGEPLEYFPTWKEYFEKNGLSTMSERVK